jgi:lipopolysaccharide/colanic/teichoic acid biosynthesis glycosyltransferase
MSVIGPRPLLVEYLPLYSQQQKLRHLVRPGLSGLAQVKGRNLLSWNEKFKYDVTYLDRISFFFDVKIIGLTIVNIIILKPVDTKKSTSMEKFTGNL